MARSDARCGILAHMSDRGDLARPDDLAAGRRTPPRYGSVGPRDPHADPVTEPVLRPVEPTRRPNRSAFGGWYLGLILSALVLIFLLIFILQNNEPVQIAFLGFSGTLPTGVALLLAAIAGVLLVAIPGSGRILQLRRAARRADRTR